MLRGAGHTGLRSSASSLLKLATQQNDFLIVSVMVQLARCEEREVWWRGKCGS